MKDPTVKTEAPAIDDLDLLRLGLSFPDIQVDFPDIEIEFPDFDVDAPPRARAPTPHPSPVPLVPISMSAGTTKSVRTTIRLPRTVVVEFKRRAAADGKRYQTLIVRTLEEWLASAPAAAVEAGRDA